MRSVFVKVGLSSLTETATLGAVLKLLSVLVDASVGSMTWVSKTFSMSQLYK